MSAGGREAAPQREGKGRRFSGVPATKGSALTAMLERDFTEARQLWLKGKG